jgi:hypothetical protein
VKPNLSTMKEEEEEAQAYNLSYLGGRDQEIRV